MGMAIGPGLMGAISVGVDVALGVGDMGARAAVDSGTRTADLSVKLWAGHCGRTRRARKERRERQRGKKKRGKPPKEHEAD